MSYNKQKSFMANVEAIETAMKIKVADRKATESEKEVMSRYSGFGGIKDVLNLGTDKPFPEEMAEPVCRLQKAVSEYPHFTEAMQKSAIESLKNSVLTAFYTPKFLIETVANQVHATFKAGNLQMRSFLEPSAGIGGFLPVAMPGTCSYAFEKDGLTGLVLSALNDNVITTISGFETIAEHGLEHTSM